MITILVIIVLTCWAIGASAYAWAAWGYKKEFDVRLQKEIQARTPKWAQMAEELVNEPYNPKEIK